MFCVFQIPSNRRKKQQLFKVKLFWIIAATTGWFFGWVAVFLEKRSLHVSFSLLIMIGALGERKCFTKLEQSKKWKHFQSLFKIMITSLRCKLTWTVQLSLKFTIFRPEISTKGKYHDVTLLQFEGLMVISSKILKK